MVSGVDSRVVLDQPGAERLIGLGDMLFQSPDAPMPKRLQGVFVSNNEIQKLVQFWKRQAYSLKVDTGELGEENLQVNIPGAMLTQTPLFDKPPEPDEDLNRIDLFAAGESNPVA